MTSEGSWVADKWEFTGGIDDSGAWITDAAAHTGTYSQAINAYNNNYVMTQKVPVEPGVYEIHMFVWADGSLGNSELTANGISTKISSNGAVQIDGQKTWDEIILQGVTVSDGWLETSVSIQNAVATGFFDDISFVRTGDYTEISPDASDGELLNGGFDSLEHWHLAGDEDAVTIDGYGASGLSDDMKLAFWKSEPFLANAYQDIKNLQNGNYTVSAEVWTDENSDAALYASNFDGSPDTQKVLSKNTGGWSKIVFQVPVVNGCLRVGASIEGVADGWLAVDNFQISYIDEDNTDDYIKNNGFEEGDEYWSIGGEIVDSGNHNSKYCLEHAKSGVQDSYQLIEDLENGYYTLTGQVQNSGSQSEAYLFASEFGSGQDAMTAIPRSNFLYDEENTWKTVTIRGIHVTNGKMQIGLHTNSEEGQYARLDTLRLVKEDNPYELIKGGDITELTYVEDFGGKFYNTNGDPVDPVEFMAESGVNMARIRVYNNPGKGRGDGEYYIPEGYQDVEDALRLAKRAKNAGMMIQLSFHYSDFWSNPGTQIIPSEWKGEINALSDTAAVDKLEVKVYDFTEEVLEKMIAQGTAPEYVSLGNEIRGGMLFPYGKVSYGNNENWDNLSRFLNAGAKAVRDKLPDSKVIIHLDDGGNASTYIDFFGNAAAENVDYDIIGTSYYPYWTKKHAYQFADFCKSISDRFGKPLLCMESGFNWAAHNGADEIGQLEHNGP